MKDGAQEAEDKRAEWARALHQLVSLEIEMDEIEEKFLQAKNEQEKTILKNRLKMLRGAIYEAEKNEEKKWKKYYIT